ncbi:hypothetical protein QTJ16_004865 [Diplocarpon rosae]|uniref:IQ domain-containing protein IQM6 n=1 Tax=Diplocarpon rosae TaxID=946125 RepID=A0AAD9SVW9_9HELO|nr:hypothetical protein QTJ16_004865 [Diplocarpon rosae]
MTVAPDPTAADTQLHNQCQNTYSSSLPTNQGRKNTSHRSQKSRVSNTASSPHYKKRDSKISVSTGSSAQSHQEYLDSLEVPSPAMVEQIGRIQERQEREIIKKHMSEENDKLNDEEREKAANLIQRNYRVHRERRMLAGLSLDPTTRWVEAVKEAQYRRLTTPRARGDIQENSKDVTSGCVQSPGTVNVARQNWKKIGLITRRAGGDEESDSASSFDDEDAPEHEREEQRKQRAEAKAKRREAAKTMDLQYFLEMVDVKHRYGSNLRTYHEEWTKSDTKENFFYWLDYGEGRFIDCQGCPRERLNREQVRYLSKEERLHYLVKIDEEGRLCWAKSGARIDTTEQYKDSMHGIVPADDNTAPVFQAAAGEAATGLQDASGESSTESDVETSDRAAKYANPRSDEAKGVKKVSHVSAATIVNKLLRSSVKKNTWIFVADTSFRLYVGIKQSGAFQHSSFLHGSRISAAGTIKIKSGQLTKLSPLSGHYRPPVSNFRAFTHSLKDAGVDMSHVSISRSYAVLVGLEAYVKTRRRGKTLMRQLVHGKDKIISPEELAKREEVARDKSESAAKEKRFLEVKRQAEMKDKDNYNTILLEKMHLSRHVAKPEGRE